MVEVPKPSIFQDDGDQGGEYAVRIELGSCKLSQLADGSYRWEDPLVVKIIGGEDDLDRLLPSLLARAQLFDMRDRLVKLDEPLDLKEDMGRIVDYVTRNPGHSQEVIRRALRMDRVLSWQLLGDLVAAGALVRKRPRGLGWGAWRFYPPEGDVRPPRVEGFKEQTRGYDVKVLEVLRKERGSLNFEQLRVLTRMGTQTLQRVLLRLERSGLIVVVPGRRGKRYAAVGDSPGQIKKIAAALEKLPQEERARFQEHAAQASPPAASSSSMSYDAFQAMDSDAKYAYLLKHPEDVDRMNREREARKAKESP